MQHKHLLQLIAAVSVFCGSISAATVITVDSDGPADYTTVQAAVDSIPSPNNTPVEIHIAPGTYNEIVRVSNQKSFVSFIGTDPATTKITYSIDSGSDPNYQTVYFGGQDFSIEGVSIENSWPTGGWSIAFVSDGQRGQFKNVWFLGNQDTLKLNSGPFYFRDCRIEGTVDFIWAAGAMMAWFENSEIYSRGGGYIACQASDLSVPYGLVFNNCQLTRNPSISDGSVYLARPWHDYGSVTYLNCWMDSHINSAGWETYGNLTVRYNEYNNSGPGGDMTNRLVATGVKILTAQEAAAITLRSVVGTWSPTYADELWANGTTDSWQAININGNAGNPPAGSASEGVLGDGCSGTALWNNRNGAGTLTYLCDAQGNITPVSLVIPTNQNIGAFDGGGTAVQCPGGCGTVIMQEYLTNGNSGMKDTWITGLKAGSLYDLYLYGHGDQESQNTIFTINGVTKSSSIPVTGLTALTEDAHYVVFRNIVSDASGEIPIQWGANSGWAGLNGLQIVQNIISTPTDLTATTWDTTVLLDWADNPEPTLSSYNVKRATTNGGPYLTIASGLTDSTYTDTAVINGTTYYYVVSAVDTSANESANSSQVSGTPHTIEAPTGLIATAGKDTVLLEWDDNAEPTWSSYNVKRATVSGGPHTTIASGLADSTYTDNTVTNGTTYFYVVSAVDTSANESGNSSQVSATPMNTTPPQVLEVVNVNFQRDSGPTETAGGAAFGPDVTLTWNNYTRSMTTISNCLDSTGAATTISITDNHTDGYYTSVWLLAYGANIMNNYHYNSAQGSKVMTIAGLTADGLYDLYIYGHGDNESQNTVFTIGSVSKATDVHDALTGSYATALTEGAHYVFFPGVQADPSGQIVVTWGPASGSGYAAINGLQIVHRLYGDIDRDNSIDLSDLDMFLNYWLSDFASLDLNGDGAITLYEFSLFAQNWLVTY